MVSAIPLKGNCFWFLSSSRASWAISFAFQPPFFDKVLHFYFPAMNWIAIPLIPLSFSWLPAQNRHLFFSFFLLITAWNHKLCSTVASLPPQSLLPLGFKILHMIHKQFTCCFEGSSLKPAAFQDSSPSSLFSEQASSPWDHSNWLQNSGWPLDGRAMCVKCNKNPQNTVNALWELE